jgi:hypothetical protein
VQRIPLLLTRIDHAPSGERQPAPLNTRLHVANLTAGPTGADPCAVGPVETDPGAAEPPGPLRAKPAATAPPATRSVVSATRSGRCRALRFASAISGSSENGTRESPNIESIIDSTTAHFKRDCFRSFLNTGPGDASRLTAYSVIGFLLLAFPPLPPSMKLLKHERKAKRSPGRASSHLAGAIATTSFRR